MPVRGACRCSDPDLLMSQYSFFSCGLQVGGKVAMDLTMPAMLAWVLGGNVSNLKGQDRAPHCRLPDKPKTFDESVSC